MAPLAVALGLVAALLVYREWWLARRIADLERANTLLMEQLTGTRLTPTAPRESQRAYGTEGDMAAVEERRRQRARGEA